MSIIQTVLNALMVLAICSVMLHTTNTLPLVEWEVEAGGYSQRFSNSGNCQFAWKAANLVTDVEPCKIVLSTAIRDLVK